MPLKKLSSSLTPEELLKLLEQEDDSPEIASEQHTDIPTFLSIYKIEHGDNLVPKRAIYHLYRKWSSEPVSPHMFGLEMGKYILKYTSSNKDYYRLNESALQLTTKAYKLVKEELTDKTKSKNWKRHFDKFLEQNNIRSGSMYIESFVLFTLYDKWTYKNNIKQWLGPEQFFKFCKLYFKSKRVTKSRMSWFSVDKSILSNFDEGQLERIRKGYYEKNKKKVKTGKIEIPRVRPGVKSKNKNGTS